MSFAHPLSKYMYYTFNDPTIMYSDIFYDFGQRRYEFLGHQIKQYQPHQGVTGERVFVFQVVLWCPNLDDRTHQPLHIFVH